MAAGPRIRSIAFVPPGPELKAEAERAISVELEDGTVSTFAAATPDEPGRRLAAGADFSCGAPVLFVRAIEEETLGEAVEAMSADIGGFWVRYYNFPAKRAKKK